MENSTSVPQNDDDAILALFDDMKHELGIFMDGVLRYLGDHPDLRVGGKQIVHSYKSRLKDREHLRTKLVRKRGQGDPVLPDELFRRVTDLAGVRIIHLFQEHFS